MKVLVQWATLTPGDWQEHDSAAWESLPAKPEPRGGEAVDDALGWVNRLNVQGVEFTGDHYAVEHLRNGCRVICWDDDPADIPPDEFCARVWTFRPLAPDPRIGGRYNTRQSQVVYAAPAAMARLLRNAPYENTILVPWAEFVPPPARLMRHGIWLSDDLYRRHGEALTPRGWREWTEGVPARHIRNGRVVG